MVARRIYEWAAQTPDKVALVHNDRPYTYAVIAGTIEAARVFFGRWSLPVGHTAIIVTRDFAQAWFLMLGLRALGLHTLCVDTVETALRLQVRSLACVVVTETGPLADGAIGRLATGAPLFIVPAALFADAAASSPHWPEETPVYGGHILYTSGTTGQHKKVLLEGRLEDGRNERWASNLSVTADTVYHNLYLPPWTAVGFDFPSCVWHRGGAVIIDQTRDMARRLGQYECNLVFVTSAMLDLLLKAHDGASGRRIARTRLVVGGGPLPKTMSERAAVALTDHITAIYGASEHHSCMIAELAAGEDAAWLHPVMDGVFDIVDADGESCAPGIEGALRVQLTRVDPDSYLDDAEATSKFFRGGYFHPGDLAMRDADGRIRILGRVGDVLNVKGHKVPVAPLEQRVQQDFGIDNACLFGGLDDNGAEELVIAIERQTMPARAELERVAQSFGQFEKVRFVAMARFPRTTAGMQKVDRVKLRALIFGPAPRPGEPH